MRFKLVPVVMGSGWISGHVAVDEHYKWSDRAGGNEICLNLDTDNPAELCREIDELIQELESLKLDVPQRFKNWKKLQKSRAG